MDCPGIEWRYCSESGDENFDTGCDEETADIQVVDQQTTLSLDGDLLKDFNQLSDIDLEASLGKIRTSNSLNEYMSKIDFCYFENDELIQMYSNDSVASEMLLRRVFELCLLVLSRFFFGTQFENVLKKTNSQNQFEFNDRLEKSTIQGSQS